MPAPVCVIAGAGGAIGSAITRRLLDGGHSVVGVGRERDRMIAAIGSARDGFQPCCADLTDDGAVTAVASAVAGRGVTMVVNAARPATPGSVIDVSPSALALAVDIKAGGLLRLLRATDSELHRGSRIVALGGRLGYDADAAVAAAGVANAAVANLVRQLAQAYGPRGVTAHVVAPGAVDSPRMRATMAPEELAALTAQSPVGQLPTVDDVAWAVVMLTEPSAAHLNGGTLLLDGGRRTASP